VAHHLKAFLADQIRGLRGDMSQAEFGRLIGKPQSVVSRLEDEAYGKVTLQTLLDIAEKLDIALVVRFADHATFLDATRDFSDNAVAPRAFGDQ
jgi:transcriptional regulator with XRE-family HTH domain